MKSDFAAANEQDVAVVLQEIVAAEQALENVYDQAQREISAPRLHELFAELSELQNQHVRALASCVSEWQQTYQQ